jgi:hypothetical protein
VYQTKVYTWRDTKTGSKYEFIDIFLRRSALLKSPYVPASEEEPRKDLSLIITPAN